MHCGDKYPDEPPTIQFVSQVNLPCVNPRNGIVDPKQLPCLANWKRENTMETALIELRRWVFHTTFAPFCPLPFPATVLPCYYLGSLSPPAVSDIERLTVDVVKRYMASPANKKIPQPPEGSVYENA